jgi:lipopolysaccharide export system permease protein
MLYRRALTREMGLTTGAVLTVLIAIALVVLFIRLLGDVARGELANEAVFAYLGFSLLYFLPVLMTIALFVGVLLPLSRMWRDSEMVIWFNAGVSLTQWMRPVLTFAVPFSLVVLLLTLVLNPWMQTKKNEYRQDLKSRSESSLIAQPADRDRAQRLHAVLHRRPARPGGCARGQSHRTARRLALSGVQERASLRGHARPARLSHRAVRALLDAA